MAKVDKKTIKKMAGLAMIDLTDKEVELYAGQITEILEHVDILTEIKDKYQDLDYKSHVDIKNIMREDEVVPGLTQEEAVSQTQNDKGYIVVPAVL